MVAQINRETFIYALHTPGPDPSDSEDVLLALATARALEAQGDREEAARWLRRAAEDAEKAGHRGRVVVLARAAALVEKEASAPAATPIDASTPQALPSSRPSTAPTAKDGPSIPPLIAALISSVPPSPTHIMSAAGPRAASSSPKAAPPRPSAVPAIPRPAAVPRCSPSPSTPPPLVSTAPEIPPPSPAAPASPTSSTLAASPRAIAQGSSDQPADAARSISTPADKPVTERTVRIGAIRVAFAGSLEGEGAFTVQRLPIGQPVPAGAMEAMLVLTGEIDGSIEMTTHLPAVRGPKTDS